jgi:hypothetical protein
MTSKISSMRLLRRLASRSKPKLSVYRAFENSLVIMIEAVSRLSTKSGKRMLSMADTALFAANIPGLIQCASSLLAELASRVGAAKRLKSRGGTVLKLRLLRDSLLQPLDGVHDFCISRVDP